MRATREEDRAGLIERLARAKAKRQQRKRKLRFRRALRWLGFKIGKDRLK